MSKAAFEAAVADAIAAAAGQQHGRAAEAWEQAAAVAKASGAWASVVTCLEAAGEAWRRDDDPRRALDCLQGSLQQSEPAANPQLTRVRMASVLAERGLGQQARPLLEEAAVRLPAVERAMAVDTLIGVLQGYGRKVDVAERVAELEDLVGDMHPAARFRRAQLHRLDGELEACVSACDDVIAALDGVPGAASGVAAAAMEQAEVASHRGDPGAAVAAFEAGRELNRSAGRTSLAWACECGRIRAAVDAGVAVISPNLDDAIARSAAKGMDRLNLDLRLVRALVWREADPRRAIAELDVVAESSASWGARIRWGHARLLQAEHFDGDGHDAWVDEAIDALSDHLPLWHRALALRRAHE